MADTDTSTMGTSPSPYDYPRRVVEDPTSPSEQPTENKGEEDNKDKPDVNIEISDDKSKEEESEVPENDEKDEDEEEKKDTEKPLLEKDDAVKIDIKSEKEGEDTPTLPLPDRKNKKKVVDDDEIQESKLPKYLFPITRIKEAWNDSSNVFQFMCRVVCIIFQTVGWFTCVGGIPFLSLVMLIIGSIYVNDCNIEPNIPIYLIVSGLIGTIQHVIVIWTNYVPKDSKGRLKVYRSSCRLLNGFFHLFLMIWFILGCVWVYSAKSEVKFTNPMEQEYCNATLYNFTFWIFNLSFILLGLLLFLSVCFIICTFKTGK